MSHVAKTLGYVIFMTALFVVITCDIYNQKQFMEDNHIEESYTISQVNHDDITLFDVTAYILEAESTRNDNTCGVSYNLAERLNVIVGDNIALQVGDIKKVFEIDRIMVPKITSIGDYDVDIYDGYIAVYKPPVQGMPENEIDLEMELMSLYKTFFLGISDFEIYFYWIWALIQILFFVVTTKTNNKVFQRDYQVYEYLGVSFKDIYFIKLIYNFLYNIMFVLVGFFVTIFYYDTISNKYLYSRYMITIGAGWILLSSLGILIGCLEVKNHR